MPDVDKIELTFLAEKETKRTYRFQEVIGDHGWSSKDVAIGPLYVQKEALDLIGSPRKIKVTIEPALE